MTTVLSPAKLNLFLHIIGQRPDGYHLLQTVFQLIDLCDEMTFTQRDDNQIVLTCNLPELATQDNLIHKAAYAIKGDKTLPGFDIHLHKIIPMGGGLGGGSSNAATALIVLNRLWELNLSEDQLLKIGLTLGADVPVFIKGFTAWGEGIGEKLTPIDLPQKAYLIVQPPVHISTPKLFASPHLTRNTKALTIRDYQQGAATHNDFETLVRAQYLAVQDAFEWLSQWGEPRLTGSGACVFIACESLQEAQDLVVKCPPPMVAFAAQGLKQSPLNA